MSVSEVLGFAHANCYHHRHRLQHYMFTLLVQRSVSVNTTRHYYYRLVLSRRSVWAGVSLGFKTLLVLWFRWKRFETSSALRHHLKFWNVSFVLFRTLGLIKPDAMQRVGDILAEVQRNGFLITNLCMTQLSRNEAFDLYKDHQSKPNFK